MGSRNAHEVEPTADTAKMMGMLMGLAGQRAESLPYLEEAVRLAPRDPQARYNLGAVYYMLDRDDQARQTLQILLQMAPNYPLDAAMRRALGL